MSNGTSSQTPWFSVSIGLMGLIVGYVLGTSLSGGLTLGGGKAPAAPSAPSAPTAPAAPQGTAPKTGIGPVLGKSSAPVAIVEFTDFQCPFCSRHFTNTFGQIKSTYIDTGKVKYELRNFPLTSIHPNAMPAAEAAMCANKQGKFWEMHEELFGNQKDWSGLSDPSAKFKEYAQTIGINASSFASCLSNHDTQAEIQKDQQDADAAGVNGTPAFWIIGKDGTGKFVSGAQPFSAFQTAIDAASK